ncbi:MAG TPA: hypothetical protein VMQ99_00770 [Acetobacteraceae bacterium]|nr:hypothetical protein [Acetobacteraceae bacterium]
MVLELANRWPARNPLSCDVALREDVELHGGGTRCADDVAFTLTRLTTAGAINGRPRHGTNRRKNVGVDKIIFAVIFSPIAQAARTCVAAGHSPAKRQRYLVASRIHAVTTLVQLDPIDASLFGARQCAALLDRKGDNR